MNSMTLQEALDWASSRNKRIAELEGETKQWKEIAKARNTDLGDLAYELAEAQAENERLLVLATKWCDKSHHDWQEILKIGGEKGE